MSIREKLLYWALGVLLLVFVAQAADEGSVTARLKIDNGFFALTKSVQNFKFDQTGTASDQGVQSITASTNSLNINNVSTPHYLWLRALHTSTSNAIFVTLTVRLEAGDVAVLPVATTNIQSYATNGTVDLEYWINQK